MMPRVHRPETPVDHNAPQWIKDYGVKWTKSYEPPAPPKQPRHFRRFRALPAPVRFVVLLTSPLWLWLTVCFLAVGGWAVLAGALVVIGVARPRWRGQPNKHIFRRPPPPRSKVMRRTKPLFQPLNF
jgi:hypothetical protein